MAQTILTNESTTNDFSKSRVGKSTANSLNSRGKR